jgi:membrane protein implicated in regulation of membrane protease activity
MELAWLVLIFIIDIFMFVGATWLYSFVMKGYGIALFLISLLIAVILPNGPFMVIVQAIVFIAYIVIGHYFLSDEESKDKDTNIMIGGARGELCCTGYTVVSELKPLLVGAWVAIPICRMKDHIFIKE